jgi:hypothetical protein
MKRTASFDHLLGTVEERGWDREPEVVGSSLVYNEWGCSMGRSEVEAPFSRRAT